MIQIPEMIDKGSDAYKEGYKNICDIGEERIKRSAGIALKEKIYLILTTGFVASKLIRAI